ncbi:MAG: DivIVA domain-containing protein [Actinomycetota bacterium]
MSLNPEEIAKRSFTPSADGYHQGEVRDFLNRVAAERQAMLISTPDGQRHAAELALSIANHEQRLAALERRLERVLEQLETTAESLRTAQDRSSQQLAVSRKATADQRALIEELRALGTRSPAVEEAPTAAIAAAREAAMSRARARAEARAAPAAPSADQTPVPPVERLRELDSAAEAIEPPLGNTWPEPPIRPAANATTRIAPADPPPDHVPSHLTGSRYASAHFPPSHPNAPQPEPSVPVAASAEPTVAPVESHDAIVDARTPPNLVSGGRDATSQFAAGQTSSPPQPGQPSAPANTFAANRLSGGRDASRQFFAAREAQRTAQQPTPAASNPLPPPPPIPGDPEIVPTTGASAPRLYPTFATPSSPGPGQAAFSRPGPGPDDPNVPLTSISFEARPAPDPAEVLETIDRQPHITDSANQLLDGVLDDVMGTITERPDV